MQKSETRLFCFMHSQLCFVYALQIEPSLHVQLADVFATTVKPAITATRP